MQFSCVQIQIDEMCGTPSGMVTGSWRKARRSRGHAQLNLDLDLESPFSFLKITRSLFSIVKYYI
jgi:hypothetical protein